MSDAQFEHQILSACVSARENYTGLAYFVGDEDFTDQGLILYKLIADYYKNDATATDIDPELLKSRVRREYKRHAKHFVAIIDEFEDVSFPNLKAEVIKFKKHNLSMRLANALLNDDNQVEELLQAYQQLAQGALISEDAGDTELFFGTDLAEYIAQHSDKTTRIRLHPLILNEHTTGALPGHHIVIFAPPECGKTMFAVNMACGMLRDGHRVLYYTNEEPAFTVILRFLSRMCNKSMEWCEENIEEAQEVAADKGYPELLVKGASPGSPDELAALVEKYGPDVVFVDQMRLLNIKGQDTGSVSHIEQAANAMRTIGKRYGTVMVSLTQAGEVGNRLLLEMTDTYMSNCLAPETKVRMFNGEIRPIKDIKIGDQVMGSDNLPRNVLAIGSGSQPMYRIEHRTGDYYDCNRDHILVVKKTTKDYIDGKLNQGGVYDVPLKRILNAPSLKLHLKGIYAGLIDYPEKKILIDPYYLGLWLSDGNKKNTGITSTDPVIIDWIKKYASSLGLNCSLYEHRRSQRRKCVTASIVSLSSRTGANILLNNLRLYNLLYNKHIPMEYLNNSIENRIKLLSGFIDGDGSLIKHKANYEYYELAVYNESLADSLKDLAKGLGFRATSSKDSNRVYLYGDLSILKCKLIRKQSSFVSKKNWLNSSFKIKELGIGEYCGITVDQDERYVLANGLITHNTGVPGSADLMIGIGINRQYEEFNKRMINLPKNKLSGKHVNFPVAVDTGRNKVTTIR